MRNCVYKYALPIEDWATVEMPVGAEVLCVQVQNQQPYLWARVQPDSPTVPRCFRVAGTGHELGTDVGRYIGSFQLHGGHLVFHVFTEKTEEL